MKETGIPMSTPEVRSYLEGRKTMTRRVIKQFNDPIYPIAEVHQDGGGNWIGWYPKSPGLAEFTKKAYPNGEGVKCPYGQVGDVLWWKEALVRSDKGTPTRYAADGCPVMRDGESIDWPFKKSTLPSIFMPRWAARISTPITGLRVERLQAITEEDAIAEGCPSALVTLATVPLVHWYEQLWDSLNAKRGHPWDANDWVFVIEFPRFM